MVLKTWVGPGRSGMINRALFVGRKCIQNEVLKRRVGLALSDTLSPLSTPTGGQKNVEKIKPKNGENFGTKMGIIFQPAFPQQPPETPRLLDYLH